MSIKVHCICDPMVDFIEGLRGGLLGQVGAAGSEGGSDSLNQKTQVRVGYEANRDGSIFPHHAGSEGVTYLAAECSYESDRPVTHF